MRRQYGSPVCGALRLGRGHDRPDGAAPERVGWIERICMSPRGDDRFHGVPPLLELAAQRYELRNRCHLIAFGVNDSNTEVWITSEQRPEERTVQTSRADETADAPVGFRSSLARGRERS